MEEKLYKATIDGNEAEVRKILKENETIKVNWKNNNYYNWTALHRACFNNDNVIVSLLLAHPDIDVNQKNKQGETPLRVACGYGRDKCVVLLLAHPDINVNLKGDHPEWTPIMSACYNSRTACIQLLLMDHRVDLNEHDKWGQNPLWLAVYGAHSDVIRWWIASGREMFLGGPEDDYSDVIGVARKLQRTDLVSLLERFKENPEETRRVVRIEMSWFDETAKIFALVVFLSDGLLEIERNERAYSEIARFFKIAKDLPMELQMVLCSRSMGSMKTNILTNESELAFKDLIKKLM